MNIIIQIISVFVIAAGIFVLLKKTDANKKEQMLKILSIILMAVFFVRYMLGNEAIRYTFALENDGLQSKFVALISILLVWFNIAGNLIIMMHPFYKIKTQSNLVKFFCLFVSVISFVLISIYTKAIVGVNAYTDFDLRIIFITLELAITIGYSAFMFYSGMEDTKKITKTEIKNMLLVLPVLLLAVMPAYTLSGIFGNAKTVIELKDLSSLHRYVLYLAVILPITIYVVLKGKDDEIKNYAMVFISIGTLITFSENYRFERFLHPTLWPLHLCNTAMYLVPICLIFKAKKLFYFTYFINVLGAFFAMAMPNYGTENVFATGVIIFYVNHFIAFFMPLLLVGLNQFERPKLKQFMYSMIAFFVYFVAMLIINAWFTNYDAGVDFFFINSDFIADKLGQWALNLRNIVVTFNIGDLKFTFYPVYQVIFFFTYVLLGLGMWFIYEFMYSISDHYIDMKTRREKINLQKYALQAQIGDEDMGQPSNKDAIDKLVIQDFKKRYGQSDVYAVKGINLTINSGEIFGFLGPNGAGKSSTIKCLVGIQGLTEGKMYVNGYDVELQSVEAKREIGFVPDHYALYEKLTGREYINYIADIYGVKQPERDEIINKYVSLLELTESFDNPIKTYSHGMKQKITIIQALCHSPKLWVLDEPLTGLDPSSIRSVKDCMISYAKSGHIVFFSSHIIDVVEKICDRIAIIKKGEIVAVSSVKEILDSGETIENYYLRHINQTEEKSDNGER